MGVYCNLCGKCCSLIPIKGEDNILVRDGLQIPDEEFLSSLTMVEEKDIDSDNLIYIQNIMNIFPDTKFYRCNYLSKENKCLIEDNKPSFCREYPSSPLAFVPDGCGYTGEIFIKNEDLKRRIRMVKEEIIDYQAKIEAGDVDSKSYIKIIENLQRFIKKYKDFGSNNW